MKVTDRKPGEHQRQRGPLGDVRHLREFELLAQAGHQHERQGEARSRRPARRRCTATKP